MDKAMLIRTVKKTWSVSMTASFVPLLISLLISHMLRDHIPGIHKGRFYYYRSSLASISYFAVVVDTTSELNLLKSELGQLTLSTAIIHDIIGLFISALSPR